MVRECANYFKSNKGFNRTFNMMLQKWKQYGRAAGRIVISRPSQEERKALSAFFGKSFMEEEIKFTVREFEKALMETKFNGILLNELLEEYFSRELLTNKMEREIKEENKKHFLDRLYNEAKNNVRAGESWLKAVMTEKKYGYNLLIGEYEKCENIAFGYGVNILKALAYINIDASREVRLAVLGAEITSNPHYFDRNTVPGRLLIWALSYLKGMEECRSAEDVLELYYISGIRPDDISSTVAMYGISLFTEEGAHHAYEGFIKNKEPYVVTMSNISRIKRADCLSKNVFIFENQTVFSCMCESLRDLPVSMMCTSGQLRTAALIAVDMLCDSGCTIYYSGDMDPEGLGIADRLLLRNGDRIVPWRFTKDDYMKCISDETISEESLKKLKRLTDSRLISLSEEIKMTKKAGYQEMLINDMMEDIKSFSALWSTL